MFAELYQFILNFPIDVPIFNFDNITILWVIPVLFLIMFIFDIILWYALKTKEKNQFLKKLLGTIIFFILASAIIIFLNDIINVLYMVIGKQPGFFDSLKIFAIDEILSLISNGFNEYSMLNIYTYLDKIFTVIKLYLILIVPMAAIRILTKNNEKLSKYLVSFFGPVYEEVVYRFILISFLVFLGFTLYESLPFICLLFALAPNHTLSFGEEGWDGYYKMYYTFILGIILGFIVIEFGIIIAIMSHIFYNTIYQHVNSIFLK